MSIRLTIVWISLLIAFNAMGQSRDCTLAYKGFDSKINQFRHELKPELFFSFTNKRLKSYYKEKDMVQCFGNVIKIDKDIYLRLEIEIDANNASKTYGYIPQTNVMTLKFIDGKSTFLYSAADAKGLKKAKSNKTVYNVFYLIKDLKILRDTELDSISIYWTTGLEEYIIYNVDFLMRQLSCLDKT